MQKTALVLFCLCILLFPMTANVTSEYAMNEIDATLTVSLDSLSSIYTWYDNILVTATVTQSGSPALGCQVLATCAINPTEEGVLLDDGVAPDSTPDDGIYTGYYRIGGNNGSAAAAQDSNTLLVTATRTGDSGSVQASFNARAAERWTGFSTDPPGAYPDNHDTYTNFIVTETPTGWHHRIENFGIYWWENAKSGTTIRLPIFPKSNTVSNLTVTGGTEAQAIDNIIQFKGNLARRDTTRFTIEFDAPSDLAATYVDRYNTGHIGLRQFRNGFIVWNAHVSQGVFGSPCSVPHGQGVSCGMQVLEKSSGLMRSIDCMERVGIVCDGTLFDSGGSYPCNVKWQEQTDNSWLQSADLSQITFQMESQAAYCDGNLKILKTVQFFSDEHYIRQNYSIENTDAVSHAASMLWGREQWLYGDTTMLSANDRGYIGTQPTMYGSGYRIDGSALTEGFFGAVDIGSHYSLAMIFNDDLPTYVYFLLTPPLAWDGGSYPVDYSGTGTDEGSTFFEKQLGTLASGEKVYHEFYMWGGYGTSEPEVQGMVADDIESMNSEFTHNISIQAGWNLISIPLEVADDSVEGMLSGIDGSWDRTFAYESSDILDPWKSHRAGAPGNDLDSVGQDMGFWLHATAGCTLSITGKLPGTTPISLKAGWNLVGYPTLTSKTISEALAGTGYDRVEGFQAVSPYVQQLSDSYMMKPGEGYWVHVPADTLWTVDW